MRILKRLFGGAKDSQQYTFNDDISSYYATLSNQQLQRLINLEDISSLTDQAKHTVRQELLKRNLGTANLDNIEGLLALPEQAERVFDKSSCPVDDDRRIWIEKSFQKLVDFFGEENILQRKVLVGEKYDFPIKFDGSERAALETMSIVARQMEVAANEISLDHYDETLQRITEGTPVGLYMGLGATGKYEISIARQLLGNAESMIAILAHEIAHIKLLGENRIEENDEPLTDLTTVIFGLGVFNANEAFRISNDIREYGWSQTGYLTQMDWGYALALFAYIRKEKQPAWTEYLCINVKADFYQGLDFIDRNKDIISLRIE